MARRDDSDERKAVSKTMGRRAKVPGKDTSWYAKQRSGQRRMAEHRGGEASARARVNSVSGRELDEKLDQALGRADWVPPEYMGTFGKR